MNDDLKIKIEAENKMKTRIRMAKDHLAGLYKESEILNNEMYEIKDKIQIARFAEKGIHMTHGKFFWRNGDLITMLGLIKCANSIDRSITREEYEAFIKVNYSFDIDAPLSAHFKKTIDDVWNKINTQFKIGDVLESWSPERIVVKDFRLK